MTKDDKRDLTEGMQRLCAVANRIVATEGKVSRMERDMLLEALRRLYDVAYELEVYSVEVPKEPVVGTLSDETMISSTVMATMAAMSPEVVEEEEMKAVVPPVAKGDADEGKKEAEPVVVAEEPKKAAVVEESKAEEVPSVPPLMEPVEEENALLFEEVLVSPEPVEVPMEEKPVAVEEPSLFAPEIVEEQTQEEVALQANEPLEDVPAVEDARQVAETTAPEVAKDEPAQPSLRDYLHKPLADQPAVRTLGEMLSGGVAAGVETMVKKVDDLRTVININDKFSFILELFKDDMRVYNDFIVQLNETNSREEALAQVEQMARRYGWDENSPTVRTFRKIFDMKF